jgi:hypothetical protein
MKPQRLFITYLLVMPLFMILLGVLMLSSWTIEKFHLKKVVSIKGKS